MDPKSTSNLLLRARARRPERGQSPVAVRSRSAGVGHLVRRRGALRLAKRSNRRRVAPWPASWRRSANGSGSGRSPSRIGSRGEARRKGPRLIWIRRTLCGYAAGSRARAPLASAWGSSRTAGNCSSGRRTGATGKDARRPTQSLERPWRIGALRGSSRHSRSTRFPRSLFVDFAGKSDSARRGKVASRWPNPC